MPGKDQLDFKMSALDWRLPEGWGKLGFDELADAGNERQDGVHSKSVHLNLGGVKPANLAPQPFLCFHCILLNLNAERIDVGEFEFGTEMFLKVDFEFLSIEIADEIKQMYF